MSLQSNQINARIRGIRIFLLLAYDTLFLKLRQREDDKRRLINFKTLNDIITLTNAMELFTSFSHDISPYLSGKQRSRLGHFQYEMFVQGGPYGQLSTSGQFYCITIPDISTSRHNVTLLEPAGGSHGCEEMMWR